MLTDDMEYLIKSPSKGHISVWKDNDLKYIDPREPHQIYILFRVLEHIMDLKQNTDEGTRLPSMIASATPMANTILDYMLKNVVHKAHSMIFSSNILQVIMHIYIYIYI